MRLNLFPLGAPRKGLAYNPRTGIHEPAWILSNWERNAGILKPTPNASGDYTSFASWVQNAGPSPTGAMDAMLLQESGDNVYHLTNPQRALSGLPSGTKCLYAPWMKATGNRWMVGFSANLTLPSATQTIIDLNRGIVTTPGSGQKVNAIIPGPNGWFRPLMEWNTNVADNATCTVAILAPGWNPANGYYQGDGKSGVLMWCDTFLLGKSFAGPSFFATQHLNATSNGGSAAPVPSSDPTAVTINALNTSSGGNLFGDAVQYDKPLEIRTALPAAPAATTLYGEFITMGSEQWPGAGLFYVGRFDNTGARFYIRTGSTGFELVHNNGSGSVVSTLPAFPEHGALVQLRAVINANGSVRLYQSVNGAPETSGALSSALAFAGAWGDTRLFINGLGIAQPYGWMGFRTAGIESGVKTLAEMVALAA